MSNLQVLKSAHWLQEPGDPDVKHNVNQKIL